MPRPTLCVTFHELTCTVIDAFSSKMLNLKAVLIFNQCLFIACFVIALIIITAVELIIFDYDYELLD